MWPTVVSDQFECPRTRYVLTVTAAMMSAVSERISALERHVTGCISPFAMIYLLP